MLNQSIVIHDFHFLLYAHNKTNSCLHLKTWFRPKSAQFIVFFFLLFPTKQPTQFSYNSRVYLKVYLYPVYMYAICIFSGANEDGILDSHKWKSFVKPLCFENRVKQTKSNKDNSKWGDYIPITTMSFPIESILVCCLLLFISTCLNAKSGKETQSDR